VPNELHIANGPASGGTILHATEIPRDDLIVAWDQLSGGPWVDFEDLEYWNRVRQKFIRLLDREACFGLPELDAEYDLVPDVDRFRIADRVCLWLGSGIADQLLLVWLVRFFKSAAVDVRKLRVIQFQHVPGADFEVTSLSGLKPEWVRQHGRIKSLTDADVDHLEIVWSALVSLQPKLLTSLLADSGDRPLPLLNRSLRCLLGRYPDRTTGLNVLDKTLLKNVRAEGPTAVSAIGATLGDLWGTLDDPSDLYLYHRLRRMGSPQINQKLVELSGPSPAMRDTQVRITETGLDVSNGKANAVEINGIDDWVCGVHLCSERNNVWYRDGDGFLMS
jgi:hypothetical protein